MKITIIGWYGTETLGDRAILDGIISIFNVDSLKEIYLGSLYPFFTERTIFEDCYSERYPGLKINLVNIYDIRQMKHAVKNSSFVLMGGGPLMELDELLLIEKVFSFAKNKKIKTAIVGCGYGPVKGDFYKATIKKIFLLSDYIIFRDSKSKEIVDKNIMNLKTFVCEDPALVSILKYSEMRKKKNNGNRNNYAIVNLRSYPEQSYGKNDELIRCLSCIPALIKNENKVFFLSMHTFFIGGDDQFY